MEDRGMKKCNSWANNLCMQEPKFDEKVLSSPKLGPKSCKFENSPINLYRKTMKKSKFQQNEDLYFSDKEDNLSDIELEENDQPALECNSDEELSSPMKAKFKEVHEEDLKALKMRKAKKFETLKVMHVVENHEITNKYKVEYYSNYHLKDPVMNEMSKNTNPNNIVAYEDEEEFDEYCFPTDTDVSLN